jgi:hypothetical protein
MRKQWLCVGFFFVSHLLAGASPQSAPPRFVGEWEAVDCGWWEDSTVRGTYNFSFSATGATHTFLQYYSGACVARGPVSQLATGKYQVDSAEVREGKVFYAVQVQYTHLSFPLFHRIIVISPNEIQVCMRPSSESCRSYRRR